MLQELDLYPVVGVCIGKVVVRTRYTYFGLYGSCPNPTVTCVSQLIVKRAGVTSSWPRVDSSTWMRMLESRSVCDHDNECVLVNTFNTVIILPTSYTVGR